MGGAGEQARQRRVVVVGGSIEGLCGAHALLRASEWLEVVVFEKARSVSAAGAGLGLDSRACDALREWGLGDALEASSLPLSMEEVRLSSPPLADSSHPFLD
jgi:2-polyprenyl-6-methoxyphenol hydroxylase-like FAD-dependent oxidoreductase